MRAAFIKRRRWMDPMHHLPPPILVANEKQEEEDAR
jgi:hypothetical protein